MDKGVSTAGASPTDETGTGSSAVAASIPDADSTITDGGKTYLRFHPLHKKVKDGTVRCVSCGQIDEVEYHDDRYCTGMGGWLPFPTSTLTLKLKADSGFRSEIVQRITLEQWVMINKILAADPEVSRPIVDQNGSKIGDARIRVADMINVEAYVDEAGTAWTPPTAWAYYSLCQAVMKKDARILELLAQGTPTRSAETTDSVGEADGGPVAKPCAQSPAGDPS